MVTVTTLFSKRKSCTKFSRSKLFDPTIPFCVFSLSRVWSVRSGNPFVALTRRAWYLLQGWNHKSSNYMIFVLLTRFAIIFFPSLSMSFCTCTSVSVADSWHCYRFHSLLSIFLFKGPLCFLWDTVQPGLWMDRNQIQQQWGTDSHFQQRRNDPRPERF